MDTSESVDERNQDHNECYQSLPHAMAFTVHFDSEKQTNTTDSYNNFTRRHVRNLSLPIPKVYENKVNTESPSNGKTLRKAGNHSEGYFSSDPDEEQGKPKLFVAKVRNTDKKISKPTNLAQEKKIMSCSFNIDRDSRDRGNKNSEQEGEDEEEEEEREGSDVASEAGTYTIDKDSPEVTTARLNIDNAFGVNSGKNNEPQIKFQMSTTHGNSTWINEWATQVIEHNHQSNTVNTRNHGLTTTKIPSPINNRARLPPVTQPMKVEHPNIPLRPLSSRRPNLFLQDECSDSSLETECFLKATERVVSAMAARVSLSLDSGGESDVETNSCSHVVEAAPATDSSASDSGQKPTQMRYNRAFSLRRGRLDEPKKKDTPVTTPVNKTRTYSDALLPKPAPTRVIKRDPPPTPSPSFSRTDCGRFSMRTRPTPTTPVLSGAKKDTIGKKKITTGSGSSGGGRSNSTLSSREVEFQNWKRRKSYDPMKAAAEGKKKEAAKKQTTSSTMTQSTNSTITTPKSPVNPVLRSASFHGTRQLTVSSSDDEEEIVLSGEEEEEEWPALQVPRTSLENTPQGSRISLYSNNSNPSSLRTRPKLEGVDNLVISALSGLSSKLKGSSCNLLKKLRYLYDEDSPKCHQLSAEIEQLEASEPGSPQVKSPSRELSTTLRNLKRLESMLKVLDDVLFDDEEFQ